MAWSFQYGIRDLIQRYQERLIQEPYSFNQGLSNLGSFAPEVWIQSDRGSLAYQLHTECNNLRRWLGFNPFPMWTVERLRLDSYYAWYDQNLTASLGYLQAFGRRGTELLGASTSVSYSGDTATLTITTPEITDGTFSVFYRVADGAPTVADERYQVFGTTSYSGGVYTFTTHKANCFKPSVQYDYINGDPKQRNALSLSDPNNFVPSFDIYRVYNDTSLQARLITLPSDLSPDIQYTEVTPLIRNSVESNFILRKKSDYPQYNILELEIYVYSGYPLSADNRMDSTLEEVLTARAKANAPLNTRLSTQPPNTLMYAYGNERANNDANGQGFLANPIGTRNIDVWSFRKLYPYAMERGNLTDRRFYIGVG